MAEVSVGRAGAAALLSAVFLGFAPLASADDDDPETRSGYEDVSEIGRGPTGISEEVLEADKERESVFKFPRADALFEPWYNLREDINERIGLQFAISETAVYQRVTDHSGKKDAAGGILEISGTWTLLNRDTSNEGIFGFKFENRHRFSDGRDPQALAFGAGSAYSAAFGYGVFGFRPVELWWEQHLFDDKFAFRVGKILPFATFDYFSLKSPKTGFLSAPFTQNPTIAFPSFGLGAAAGYYPTKDIYIVAGIHDANAKPTRTGGMFDSFFNDSDFFKSVEVGWDPEFSFGKGSYHAMGWHVDRRNKNNIPSDGGLALGGEQNIGDIMLFLRYGYSNDNASVLKHMVAGGLAFKNVFDQDNDVIGLGGSWGKLAKFEDLSVELDGEVETFSAVENEDQYNAEVYYRVELTPRLSVTPNVQGLFKPATNTEEDAVGVFGVRARFAM